MNSGSTSPGDHYRHVGQFAIADAATPPDRKPLFRPLPPATEFPIGALGPLAAAVRAIQARTQAPVAIVAQSVLAAVTLAVQGRRDVNLPGGGRRPLTGMFISIADSGERKSSVDRLALRSVYRFEEELRKESAGQFAAYKNAKEAWEAARTQAKRVNRGNPAAARQALDQTGPEPKPPADPMLLVSDPTPEALVLHLAGRPMAGVFTAEGGILIGGSAFNDESRMRTGALLNCLWDGDAIRRRRVTTGSAFLPGRRCSAHIMLQPVVANKLFGDSMLDGIGLTARMLIAAPDSTAGTRLFREPPPEAALHQADYDARLMALLGDPPFTRPDEPDVLDPPTMDLSADAAAAWTGFHDHCERAIGPGGALAEIRAFGAKLAEHAGRLAAVLALYDDPGTMAVPLVAMESGIALATYYANELLRLHGGAHVSGDLRQAQQLLDWWRCQSDPIVHLSMIYQFGPQPLRSAAAARKAATILEDHGWVERLEPGIMIGGEARKVAWRLKP